MPRKPIDIIAAAKRPEGRDVVWRAIRRLRADFTLLDLEHDTRVPVETIRTYLQGLTHAGYLRKDRGPRQADGSFPPARWTLIRDVGAEAPRVTRKGQPVTQGAGREQIWRGVRILGEFSVDELHAAAGSPVAQPTRNEVATYIKHLHQARYLKRIAKHNQGGACSARYRLIPARNTGPLAPMVQRTKRVWDPNLGEVVWREADA